MREFWLNCLLCCVIFLSGVVSKAEKSVEILSSRVSRLEDVNGQLEERLESTIERLQESMKIVDEFER